MNEVSILKEKNSANYLDNVNKIINYIETTIIPSNNNPFIKYTIFLLDDSEYHDWEVDLYENGEYSTEELFKFHKDLLKILHDYAEKNNCVDVLHKIAFVI